MSSQTEERETKRLKTTYTENTCADLALFEANQLDDIDTNLFFNALMEGITAGSDSNDSSITDPEEAFNELLNNIAAATSATPRLTYPIAQQRFNAQQDTMVTPNTNSVYPTEPAGLVSSAYSPPTTPSVETYSTASLAQSSLVLTAAAAPFISSLNTASFRRPSTGLMKRTHNTAFDDNEEELDRMIGAPHLPEDMDIMLEDEEEVDAETVDQVMSESEEEEEYQLIDSSDEEDEAIKYVSAPVSPAVETEVESDEIVEDISAPNSPADSSDEEDEIIDDAPTPLAPVVDTNNEVEATLITQEDDNSQAEGDEEHPILLDDDSESNLLEVLEEEPMITTLPPVYIKEESPEAEEEEVHDSTIVPITVDDNDEAPSVVNTMNRDDNSLTNSDLDMDDDAESPVPIVPFPESDFMEEIYESSQDSIDQAQESRQDSISQVHESSQDSINEAHGSSHPSPESDFMVLDFESSQDSISQAHESGQDPISPSDMDNDENQNLGSINGKDQNNELEPSDEEDEVFYDVEFDNIDEEGHLFSSEVAPPLSSQNINSQNNLADIEEERAVQSKEAQNTSTVNNKEEETTQQVEQENATQMNNPKDTLIVDSMEEEIIQQNNREEPTVNTVVMEEQDSLQDTTPQNDNSSASGRPQQMATDQSMANLDFVNTSISNTYDSMDLEEIDDVEFIDAMEMNITEETTVENINQNLHNDEMNVMEENTNNNNMETIQNNEEKEAFYESYDEINCDEIEADNMIEQVNIIAPASQLESLPSFHTDTQLIPETWKDQEASLIGDYIIPTETELNSNEAEFDDVVEEDGSLNMWWYDACASDENTHLYLFGKAYDLKHNKYVSCCVTVENIKREIYVLPRKFRLDDEEQATQIIVSLDDVKEELEEKMKLKNIKNYKMDVCTKKYAFELPDIPQETQYIKLTYPFHHYRFTQETSGQTFSHMFGNTVKLLEQFIIQKDIMGPCWLQFKDVSPFVKKQSWCAVEGGVRSPASCSVKRDEKGKPLIAAPPLNIMSLSVQFRLNHQSQLNEILAVSGFVCPETDIDNQDDATSLLYTRFSITRRVPGANQPRETRLVVEEEKQKTNLKIMLEKSEEALLQRLICQIRLFDADIIVGHNFANVDLDILLHRMKQFKVQEWSQIGRRRLKKWPKLQPGAGGSGTSTYDQELVIRGRLICDTYTASKDLVKSKSYRLSDLALSQLNIIREDMTLDMIKEYSQNGSLDLELARRGSFDAYLSFSLMVKLQILPLTKQLTNLSGNLWYRSMNGARSERNEYLLLHTFYNKGYICPDKPNKKRETLEVLFADDTLELEQSTKARKGAKGQSTSFLGGLVLEPKAGLYDKYVILLDFNSLYPSIMQEFNVCFTTMKREPEGSENFNATELPEVPSPDCPEGILPSLVRMFVNQRRHVKKLMKDPNISKSAKMQYDIEQMALKLTANSMYGCLGSSISRFYARPLAMFITSKGRDILRSTVDLAESKNLDVIYGDTDSIMINTNQAKMYRAKTIGEKLKNEINKRYSVLDIGIDGFFRHTLLLRKKKYAALLVKEKTDGHGLQETVIVKGLDLVRRDWCGLSHDVSENVLGIILSDKNREEVVERIHSFLKLTATKVRMSEFKLEDFIIRKQLTKAPEEYKKSKSQPHVQVAKDMRRSGIAVKAGDTIPYVMCSLEDSAGSEPRMPEDVANMKAQLDLKWYMHKQILPPVNRLCGPIKGTDLERLASCLGLGKEEMLARLLEDDGEDENTAVVDGSDALLFTGQERYARMEPLTLRCGYCNHKSQYSDPASIISSNGDTDTSSLVCNSCNHEMKSPSVYVQVMQKIRNDINQYYDSQFICDQESCGYTTRSISTVASDECKIRGCDGKLTREFSERMLYDRLSQLAYLFDEIENNHQLSPVKSLIHEHINLSNYKYMNISDMLHDKSINLSDA